MKPAYNQFRSEVIHFSIIALLNIIFSAMAIAFGIQYMITAITGASADPATVLIRLVTGCIAMISFGLGISWLLSSVGVFEGLENLCSAFCTGYESLTEERMTCHMVRMLAHYRDKKATIHTMVWVCTFGGLGFFILAIITGLKAFSFSGSGVSFTFDSLLLIPGMLLTLGIAITSLLSSWYFTRFSRTWDKRLSEIDASECALKEKLGLDEA